MPVFDHALMFQSTGNITATGYATNALKISGTPINGLGVRIVFPSSPGTTVPILPSMYVSDDDSTYPLAATYPGGAQSWATGGNELVFGFISNKKYAKLYFTVTSGTTGSSFGAVQAGIIENVGWDWPRAVGFETP
jgi:hypothetical protein